MEFLGKAAQKMASLLRCRHIPECRDEAGKLLHEDGEVRTRQALPLGVELGLVCGAPEARPEGSGKILPGGRLGFSFDNGLPPLRSGALEVGDPSSDPLLRRQTLGSQDDRSPPQPGIRVSSREGRDLGNRGRGNGLGRRQGGNRVERCGLSPQISLVDVHALFIAPQLFRGQLYFVLSPLQQLRNPFLCLSGLRGTLMETSARCLARLGAVPAPFEESALLARLGERGVRRWKGR